eukprot:CAMPEP_0184691714 /NCGR_PEP_ID=MMETSP0313-20130426/474_1 /TAXON_ID=2792 /ORGANISM="Porphyridium aerugineum, Strain SAG 1380-2" /LENGTH=193 /DNA_ID=CAMNT_0027149473 /DNA_START=83 /DNA_END=664 /DNA_ORIENTATION=-
MDGGTSSTGAAPSDQVTKTPSKEVVAAPSSMETLPQMVEGSERIIIVAVDGSPAADHALEWTSKNILRTGDHVCLVYVQAPPIIPEFNLGSAGYANESLWTDILRHAEKTTHDIITKYTHMAHELAKLHQARIDVFCEKGDVRNVITQFATISKADLVVCGNRGYNAMQYFIMGSTSMYLVNHLKMPVLVIHS